MRIAYRYGHIKVRIALRERRKIAVIIKKNKTTHILAEAVLVNLVN
jgi:hypothetical protein